MSTNVARLEGARIVLPGIATAHSHAFQRVLRSRTHRLGTSGRDFWSWRDLMYRVADQLDPETMYDVARFAYAELALAGVTAVGEFHYVHHQRGGEPYAQRTVMAEAVIRAARDIGLRIALLRVVYQRAGAGRPPEGVQKRFSDRSIDDALADIDQLRGAFQTDHGVTVGVAPHSVRAVKREGLRDLARFAGAERLPFHIHVAEQKRELAECEAEHGVSPVELLEQVGAVNDRLVAVHLTHATSRDIAILRAARSTVCVCRTTERDLGDGAPDATGFFQAALRVCLGVDSYAESDPFVEARAVELDERVRTGARLVAAGGTTLLQSATASGYAAIGMADEHARDEVALDANAALFAGLDPARIDDFVVFGGHGSAVRDVRVQGRSVVEDAGIWNAGAIRQAYEGVLEKLTGI